MAGKLVWSLRHDYTITPVTTAAFVELEPSLPKNVRRLEIFDSSGETLELAYGPSGSETMALQIVPGGNEYRDCLLNMGMRISIKALSNDASVGELTINAFY